MDANRFDHVVRTWAEAGPRRPVLGLLAGGVAGLAGLADTSARRKKKKKVTLCLNGQTITIPKKQQGSYLSQGATSGKCPATCVRQCTGKTCGPDGCGGTCGDCPGDKTCQGGTCECPTGETECVPGVCVPPGSVCCTELQCGSGEGCVRGQCIMWQGTCPQGVNSCNHVVPCSGDPACSCLQSTEGDTRCGDHAELSPRCNVCQTSADCAARFPDVPGAFCGQTGSNPGCCSGTCWRPCPSA